MLSGRESLIRLVGKRRRFLPNRQSLTSFDFCTDEEQLENEEKLKNGGEKKTSNPLSDWVICPVCGSNVRGGDDFIINSHLDVCLSRGTKRKMMQRTLFELNFCSQASSGREENKTIATSICSANRIIAEGNNGNPGKLTQTVENVSEINASIDSLTKKLTDHRDGISCWVNFDPSFLDLKKEVAKCEEAITVDDVSVVPLDTFIVGRKFCGEKESVNPGANVSLLREPDNVKDANALQVLLADSGCCKMLGYLPRDLAQYLSPLIDKYSLTFEGCVTCVSKHSLDVISIQIVCREVMLHISKDNNETEDFTCLWNNVLRVVESAKHSSSSMPKYQQNFCVLIQEVLKSSPHLFTDDEEKFMESFMSLSDDGQRLFVRLYTRKGPWFRMSKISYPEVLDSQQAIKDLSAMDFMCSFDGVHNLEENEMEKILNLLTVSELHEITCMFKCALLLSLMDHIFCALLGLQNDSRGSRKQDLIASICSSYEDGICPYLPIAILDRTGICVKISLKAESLIWRAQRLFFLNGEQDLSAFLLVDLGIVKYPTYNCIISKQIFSARCDLLAYEEAIEIAQIMDESLDENDSELVLRCINIADSRMCSKANQSEASETLATFFSRFSASWIYSKVVYLGVSFFERERRYKDAVNLLKRLLSIFTYDGRRGHWILRLSIDLQHVGCPNESLSVAEDGMLDPWVRAGSRMALQRRVLRLGKPPRRWKVPSFSQLIKRKIKEVHIQGRPLNNETGMKSRFYGEDGEQCGVEQLALQYYAGEGGGWQGVHTESGIWLTIFGLLLWDIIFSDVPDVFQNRFQTAPLDLETDSFYVARKSQIESQLLKIHDGMAEEILITSWELHSGTSCRGVNWDRHSLSELRAAVACIGGPCLASFCRHLAQDHRSWSSGMPDLFLWRFHEEHKGEAKLVEVKGPRDRLSEQQRAWLLLLMDCGFNAEVCKVSPVPLSA